MIRYIKKADLFAVNPADQLYFVEQQKNKTFVGGICSIFLALAFVLFARNEFIPIYNKEKTYFNQVAQTLGPEEQIQTIDENSVVLWFWINSPAEPWGVFLDSTKIDVYVKHLSTNKRYEVDRCVKSDLKGWETDEMLNISFTSNQPTYCIKDPSRTLTTTKNTYESWQFIISRCESDLSNNKTCSSDQEITQWLEDKTVQLQFFDVRLNMSAYDEEKLLYRENIFKQIKLNLPNNEITSAYFQYRNNSFLRTDSFFGFKSDPFYFVDYVPGEFLQYHRAGKEIFLLNAYNCKETIQYKRIVQNVFDWIGKIAGIPNLLYICIRVLTGGYQTFNANMQIAKKLKFLSQDNFGQLRAYHFSGFFNKIFQSCQKSKDKEKLFFQKLQKVKKKVKQQFDFTKILLNVSNLIYHQDLILRKLKLGNRNCQNEMTIFNLGTQKKKNKNLETQKEIFDEESQVIVNNDSSINVSNQVLDQTTALKKKKKKVIK